MLLSKCVVCDSKKSKFIKEQEARGLLSSLGRMTPLSKTPLLGPLCFKSIQQVNTRYKMNEIANKFLLAGDKFMPEMHIRKPGYTYSACGPFTKSKERIKKIKETERFKIYLSNELNKTCFQRDMASGGFKDLTRRTAADKVLRDKVFNIAKDPKYEGYQSGFLSMVYKFSDKKPSGSGIKNENISNKELAEELHKPIIEDLMKEKYTHVLLMN